MTNYKLIYSIHGENKQGKLNDLLNQVKKINLGAKIQYTLREMSNKKSFNEKKFYNFLESLLETYRNK